MLSYLTAFIFYTLAMVGILLIAFVVYKKFNFPTKQENRGIIHIVDSCPIGAKKNLLVVKIGNEKFLIASGLEHTTFLSKLDNNISQILEETPTKKQETIQNIMQHTTEIKKPKEDKDVYDFLYNQSKKLEVQRQTLDNEQINKKINSQPNIQAVNIQQNQQINTQQQTKNVQNSFLKELYATNEEMTNSNANSRKQLMQELLKEIHETKLKTGSRF